MNSTASPLLVTDPTERAESPLAPATSNPETNVAAGEQPGNAEATTEKTAAVPPGPTESAGNPPATAQNISPSAPRIVCGTDFSHGAAAAAGVGTLLARRLRLPLHLVNALKPHWLEMLPAELRAETQRTFEAHFGMEVKKLRETGDVVTGEFRLGAADQVLVEMGRESGTELLVLSAVGEARPGGWRLGSTAERVAELATVPTLVVRDAEPFNAWAAGTHRLRIMVATDFSEASEAALAWVTKLWATGECDIVAVHVGWPPGQQARQGEPLRGGVPVKTVHLQQTLEAALARQCGLSSVNEHCRVRIQPGTEPVDAALLRVAQEEHSDLIVMGSHAAHGPVRLRHGSALRGVLQGALVSVACIPAVAREREEAPRLPEFRHVLVATDLTHSGNRAIPYAYGLVQTGGTVCLLYVIPPPAGLEDPHGNSPTRRVDLEALERNADGAGARLRALIPAEAEGRGISTEIKVIEDTRPAGTICEVADHFGADAICLASQEHTGLARAWRGSVVQEVLAQTPRPVLVLREEPNP